MTTTEKAVKIVCQLQEWIESFDGLSLTPVASMTCSRDTLSVSIADVVVWDDQSYYCDEREETELTLEGCKSAWIAHLASYRPFIGEARHSA